MTNYNHNSKYKYNFDTFFSENDISHYLLGAFMTDGCIQATGTYSWMATLSSKDEDWLQLIREYICPEMKISQGNQVKVLSVMNKEIGCWFISKGCVPRKSTIVEVPPIPEEYIPDFLRGCWDGDGCISFYISKKTNKLIYSSYLCSASLKFLEKISKILKVKNISNSICEVHKKECMINGRLVKPKNAHYRLTLGARATYELVEWLYYPNHRLSMPRKNSRAQTIIKHFQNLE